MIHFKLRYNKAIQKGKDKAYIEITERQTTGGGKTHRSTTIY